VFSKQRAIALQRLVRRGMPLGKADAWLEAWDTTTVGLVDFRRAPDFWRLGYEYAREEYRLGYEPPVMAAASEPSRPLRPSDELAAAASAHR
jgi:hypothetical protein